MPGTTRSILLRLEEADGPPPARRTSAPAPRGVPPAVTTGRPPPAVQASAALTTARRPAPAALRDLAGEGGSL